MKAEVIMPMINELPTNEKRRLLEWLQQEVDTKPEPEVKQHLRSKLIRHIEKARRRNASKK